VLEPQNASVEGVREGRVQVAGQPFSQLARNGSAQWMIRF
jgi:hypothetical protein